MKRLTLALFVALAILASTLTPARANENSVLSLPDDLTQRMAEVAKGEDGRDPTMPACVMRNRILNGWNPWKVLNHFYAPAIKNISDAEVEAVRAMLAKGEGCDRRAYFFFTGIDFSHVHPAEASFLFNHNGNYYYDIYAFKGGPPVVVVVESERGHGE